MRISNWGGANRWQGVLDSRMYINTCMHTLTYASMCMPECAFLEGLLNVGAGAAHFVRFSEKL